MLKLWCSLQYHARIETTVFVTYIVQYLNLRLVCRYQPKMQLPHRLTGAPSAASRILYSTRVIQAREHNQPIKLWSHSNMAS